MNCVCHVELCSAVLFVLLLLQIEIFGAVFVHAYQHLLIFSLSVIHFDQMGLRNETHFLLVPVLVLREFSRMLRHHVGQLGAQVCLDTLLFGSKFPDFLLQVLNLLLASLNQKLLCLLLQVTGVEVI